MAEMENNDYYNKSLKALIEYIEQEKKTITEVEWNRVWKNGFHGNCVPKFLPPVQYQRV